jgi:hypothetical protein
MRRSKHHCKRLKTFSATPEFLFRDQVGRRFKSSLPDQFFSRTYNFLIAPNRAQNEPLVRLDWVPQNKYLDRKDLGAVAIEPRGTHKNEDG